MFPELAILLWRSLFFYFLVRLAVKGLMANYHRNYPMFMDLFVLIMVVQISVMAIERPEKPLFLSLVSIFVMLLIHQLVRFLFNKHTKIKRDRPYQSQSIDFFELSRTLKANGADVEMASLDLVGMEPSAPARQLPVPLILDGRVLDPNLNKLGKTRFWLKNEVQKFGVRRFKEVAFCSINHDGKLFVDKKKN